MTPGANQACIIDINSHTIYIKNAFGEDPEVFYSGKVIVQLHKVKNPPTNLAMGFYTISTFAD